MESYTEKIRKWILRVTVSLLCITLASFWMVCNLYARYTSADGGGDAARVAAFVFDIHDTANHFFDVSRVDAPGKQATYQFSVTNANAVMACEVSEEYQISAEINGSLPLSVRIMDESGRAVVTLDAPTADNGTSNAVMLPAGQATTNQYTLQVEWPEDEKDLQYANAGLSEIALRISVWQVD